MACISNRNPGQFSSWHMERRAENKYSDGDQTSRPAAGEASKYIVTDGRPAGTHVRSNAWHDGGPGARGARSHDLAKFNGTAYEPQSANDAPFMKGDRSRTADGTLREVRSDELVRNNPTLSQRAPDVVKLFGDATVGDVRQFFGGMSVTQIGKMDKAERTQAIQMRMMAICMEKSQPMPDMGKAQGLGKGQVNKGQIDQVDLSKANIGQQPNIGQQAADIVQMAQLLAA